MTAEPRPSRLSLVRSLSALIPQDPYKPGRVLIAYVELRRLVRSLRDAFQRPGPVAWPVVRSALGRLRGLYLDPARRGCYSRRLIRVLAQVSLAFPSLKEVKPVKAAPRVVQGGRDERAKDGYLPQHRSRFRGLLH
jgi:hypothetical protein